MKFEPGAVVVETGKPDAFYARLTELAASGEYGAIEEVTSPDDNLQAVFQYLVKMTMAETDRDPAARSSDPGGSGFLPSSLRIFDLSLGEMLWSRRTIFMVLVVGAPVLIALFLRVLVALGAPILDGTCATASRPSG